MNIVKYQACQGFCGLEVDLGSGGEKKSDLINCGLKIGFYLMQGFPKVQSLLESSYLVVGFK